MIISRFLDWFSRVKEIFIENDKSAVANLDNYNLNCSICSVFESDNCLELPRVTLNRGKRAAVHIVKQYPAS